LDIGNTHVEVVPNCVSDEFKPHKKTFNSECPRILQIGTKENKNLQRVSKALHGIQCKLVIVGDLSKEQRLDLGNGEIDFENHVGLNRVELVSQYQQADIVMFASLYEGFGMPILEANAVGRVVVLSRLFSMPEVGGDSACYVDPYVVADIRDAVVRISRDVEYRNRLIGRGFKNVGRFFPKVIAAKYANVYREVFGQF